MSPIHAQMPLPIQLRVDATIDNYIGDAGNRLLGTDGVIYVWGDPGSGRSHLLQGACHHTLANHGSAIYLSELSAYAPDILEGLSSLDLVCIDDVQTVIGDDEWEAGLFHLVNYVREYGGKLVISANQPPLRLAVQLNDLKSRLLAAHTVETDRLNDAAKIRLLQEKAERQGFTLADEVCRFILSRTDRDLRSLVDLLGRLEVETLRHQKRVTIPFVKQVIEA